MENKTYAIGEKINAIDPCHPNAASGGKMTDGYIGADHKIHFRSGNSRPIKQGAVIQGYSVPGLAHFIWIYLRNYTPINENLLSHYDVGPECVEGAIMDALGALGFCNRDENRV